MFELENYKSFIDQDERRILPIYLYEDNQACIESIRGKIRPKKLRHIRVCYHILRDYYESGDLVVSKIESELQLADLLTNALDPESFARHRNRILSTGECQMVLTDPAHGISHALRALALHAQMASNKLIVLFCIYTPRLYCIPLNSLPSETYISQLSSTTMEDSRNHFVIYDGTNFEDWLISTTKILQAGKHWGYYTGKARELLVAQRKRENDLLMKKITSGSRIKQLGQ
jgi:hypothetical protein